MRYALFGLLLLAAGCGVKPPIEGRQDPFTERQISFADQDLREKTALGIPRMERRNEGILFVTLPIRSASDYDLHIDYRVAFLDEDGMTIYQSGWTGGKTLPANAQDYLTFNSPSANAADFRLQLRYAK